ncbi:MULTISPECIES: tetratricopeptide repeat protein [Odoribacteraceae]|uniref:tetratricopeptide repeat protein n=1 Tax=Odoribacteraceae TaxID=1853231 RepID=UPI000E4E04D3|nr:MULTISPECIES: tetratricopeptide repeat protein [Odoribacteraceae]MCQ4874725.1 tetratricopeptide repeat protein [Butyricimonas paravirosa]RHR80478.1 tetratricopeptide repeat protein [Odoribacter sp. AF15-53]
MSKEKQKRADGFEQIEEATISTEQFIEKNQKLLIRGVLVIVIVVGAILGYYRFYKAPLEEEALKQMFVAENLFEKDSFNMALNGDGNAPGFLEIIDRYGSTPSGNLANYYAGICYLHLGDNQNAIKYLEKFSSDDVIFSSMVKANLGDAYMQQGDFKKASSYYQKATTGTTNMVTTPMILMKAGLAFEKANDYKNALSMYERIEKEFPASMEAAEIEKYITRAKLSMK